MGLAGPRRGERSRIFQEIWVSSFAGILEEKGATCVLQPAFSATILWQVEVWTSKADLGFGLEEVAQHIVDILILLMLISLGILSCIPKT
jgi:hypothetical protein